MFTTIYDEMMTALTILTQLIGYCQVNYTPKISPAVRVNCLID